MADITNQQVLEGITELINGITDIMVTKDDLKNALKDYPTKEDLKNELKAFATKDDFHKLERKVDAHHTSNIKHHLETRKMIGELNSKHASLREGLAKAAGAI